MLLDALYNFLLPHALHIHSGVSKNPVPVLNWTQCYIMLGELTLINENVNLQLQFVPYG